MTAQWGNLGLLGDRNSMTYSAIDIGNESEGTLPDDFFNRIYVVKEIRHTLNLTGCVFCVNLPFIYQGKLKEGEVDKKCQISQIDRNRVD